MSEFYNCNYSVGDIIIGIEPSSQRTYLRVFRIKDFTTHNHYGHTVVDSALVEYLFQDHLGAELRYMDIEVKSLNHYFRRIVVEEV